MRLCKWKPKNQTVTKDLFDYDHPFFGLSLLPSFDQIFSSIDGGLVPALDVSEDKESFLIQADLPGVDKQDIQVSINNHVLTLRGERKIEKDQKENNYAKVERSYGAFERSIDLGQAIDQSKVKATYTNGVLKLVLPKSQKDESKKIEIQ